MNSKIYAELMAKYFLHPFLIKRGKKFVYYLTLYFWVPILGQ